MKLSVCIPMYNEAAIAKDAALTFSRACDEVAGGDGEVIFCDDGSTDGCGDIIRGLGLHNVRVVGYEHNRGKGCAVRTAVMEAKGDILVCTDCDNAYGTDKIAEAVANLDADRNAEIVIGSRILDRYGYEGYTWWRRLMSRTYILVLKLAAGFRHSDSQCGFKAWRRDAARASFSLCETDGWAFDIEVIMIAEKFGFRVREMPVRIINHRESKVNPVRDTLRMLRDLKKIKKHVKSLFGTK